MSEGRDSVTSHAGPLPSPSDLLFFVPCASARWHSDEKDDQRFGKEPDSEGTDDQKTEREPDYEEKDEENFGKGPDSEKTDDESSGQRTAGGCRTYDDAPTPRYLFLRLIDG